MLKKNKPQQPFFGKSAVFLLRFFNKIYRFSSINHDFKCKTLIFKGVKKIKQMPDKLIVDGLLTLFYIHSEMISLLYGYDMDEDHNH